MLYTVAVSGQECTDTVGSLSHNNNMQHIVTEGHTYVLAGYTVPCSGTVVAWEFCYRLSAGSATFYPGVWKKTNGSTTDYVLVRSNNVTYRPVQIGNTDSCQLFNITKADQFSAPAGSLLGFSSVGHSLLLRTNNNVSVTNYQFIGNLSRVGDADNKVDINYNIAIKLHLGNYIVVCTFVRVLCVHCVKLLAKYNVLWGKPEMTGHLLIHLSRTTIVGS